jgi:chemotaxis protein MotB
MRNLAILVAASSILCLVTGCATGQHQRKIAALEAQLENTRHEKQSAEAQLKELQDAFTAQQEKLHQVQSEADKLSELLRKLEDAKEAKDRKLAELQDLVKNISGMSVQSRREGNFLVIENNILFESGKISLSEEAKETLDSTVIPYLQEQLQEKADQEIRIDGHTDGQPIQASDWLDNYHLAAMRAHSVMEYLAAQGIPERNMYICGYGPNRPLIQPDNPEAPVAQNRRVEILLTPPAEESIEEILKDFQN